MIYDQKQYGFINQITNSYFCEYTGSKMNLLLRRSWIMKEFVSWQVDKTQAIFNLNQALCNSLVQL